MTITVLSAVYGTNTHGNDVTSICQALIFDGNDDIPVNNAVLGPDPDYGKTKSFGIIFSSPSMNGGNPIALACQEGASLDLVPVPTTATTVAQKLLSPARDVTVIHAVYGTSKNGNDVTAICQAMVNEGNYNIPVNNTVLGPDPEYGATKSFAILLQAPSINHGSPVGLACQEGTTLTLPTGA